MPDSPFRIGDRVAIDRMTPVKWDGTVVDIIDPNGCPPLVRVYWRYPLGKVSDYHASELARVV